MRRDREGRKRGRKCGSAVIHLASLVSVGWTSRCHYCRAGHHIHALPCMLHCTYNTGRCLRCVCFYVSKTKMVPPRGGERSRMLLHAIHQKSLFYYWKNCIGNQRLKVDGHWPASTACTSAYLGTLGVRVMNNPPPLPASGSHCRNVRTLCSRPPPSPQISRGPCPAMH